MGARKKALWRYPNTSPRVRKSYCHSCKQEILSALYDARPHRFDPQALTQLGEVVALALGHTTWLVAGENYLSRRNTWAIKTSPCGIGGRIIRSHECGRSPDPDHINFPESKFPDNPGF